MVNYYFEVMNYTIKKIPDEDYIYTLDFEESSKSWNWFKDRKDSILLKKIYFNSLSNIVYYKEANSNQQNSTEFYIRLGDQELIIDQGVKNFSNLKYYPGSAPISFSLWKNQQLIIKNHKPTLPALVGPFKIIKDISINGIEFKKDELITYQQLFSSGSFSVNLLMQAPFDEGFGLDSKIVTVSSGLIEYYENNTLKRFNGTEEMTKQDFFNWWGALKKYFKNNISHLQTGIEVDKEQAFTSLDDFTIWSSGIGFDVKYLNPFKSISNGIEGYLENQQGVTCFAFLKLPYSSYELTFDTQHFNLLPLKNKLNRPYDSGLLLDIPNLSSIPIDGINYDDINMQGYQLFNIQHPGAKGIIVNYPYGGNISSWITFSRY